jgi:hypothetical protein
MRYRRIAVANHPSVATGERAVAEALGIVGGAADW